MTQRSLKIRTVRFSVEFWDCAPLVPPVAVHPIVDYHELFSFGLKRAPKVPSVRKSCPNIILSDRCNALEIKSRVCLRAPFKLDLSEFRNDVYARLATTTRDAVIQLAETFDDCDATPILARIQQFEERDGRLEFPVERIDSTGKEPTQLAVSVRITRADSQLYRVRSQAAASPRNTRNCQSNDRRSTTQLRFADGVPTHTPY